jgi:hypothetical protein
MISDYKREVLVKSNLEMHEKTKWHVAFHILSPLALSPFHLFMISHRQGLQSKYLIVM